MNKADSITALQTQINAANLSLEDMTILTEWMIEKIKTKRSEKNLDASVAFKVGAKVRVINPGRKYDGAEGTIIRRNPTKAVIALDQYRELSVPYSMLELR